jgi:hypothetical protein
MVRKVIISDLLITLNPNLLYHQYSPKVRLYATARLK